MADASNAAMMERLERVETKIDRLEMRFDHLETRFNGLEAKVDDLAMYVVATETRLVERIDAQARRYDIQIEHVRDDIRKLGESFGGVLERIEGRLAGIQTETNTRMAGHELVLSDHGRRITALELPPP
jgi:hypothetical protein